MNLLPNNASCIEPQGPDPERVRWLREQIAEMKKRWPPHSVPASMLQRLEDLEDELETELRKPDTLLNLY
jgi:hypothetical protein